MSEVLEETGPIDYLIVEFPGNRMTGEGFPLLLDLVDSGTIRILDLVFATRDTDGSLSVLRVSDLDGDGELDLSVFEGAASGLLGPDDLDEAASAIEPGNSAGILIYENTWAAPFAAALRRSGAQLVASGRIPVQAILAALEATEALEAAEVTEVTEVTKTVLGSTQLVVNGTPSEFEINSDAVGDEQNVFCVCGLGGSVSFVFFRAFRVEVVEEL